MGVPVADLPFKDLHTHHIYELSPGAARGTGGMYLCNGMMA